MKLLIVAIAILIASQAEASSRVDERGFETCVDGVTASLKDTGYVAGSSFQLETNPASRVYYLQGQAWADDGTRTRVLTTCTTDRRGMRVVQLESSADKTIRSVGLYAINSLAVR